MKPRMNRKTVAWLCRVSGREKWNIAFLTAAQAFLGISSIVFAWLLRGAVDCAVNGDRKGFLNCSAAMVLLVVLQISARALKRFLDEYTKSGLENCFKARLFQQLLTRDYAHVTAVHSGEWMSRLTSDTAVVAEGMTTILPDMIGMGVRLVGAVTALILLVPQLSCLIIPGGALLLLFSTAFRRKLKSMHTDIQKSDGKLRVVMSDRLSSLLIVRAFAREEQMLRDAAGQMEDHREARMARCHFSNFCNVGLSAVMNGVYMIGVLYCGYGILTGSVSYGSFTAVLQLIGQIQSPFANLTGYLPKFYGMLASAERLMEAEQFDAASDSPVLTPEEISVFYRERFAALGSRDVSFTYLPPAADKDSVRMPVVLENMNLEIRKGECVAFTGQSGSGKSTVLKLLMTLYQPDSGWCYVETADGQQEKLDARYTRLFAYVPQGNHLMSGSIREAVAFSDREKMAEEEGIRRALEIACALDFVDELPEGLDTVLGERGAGLSEGQMQRIAIARAICSGNPVLVLDEATSALDEATEKKLMRNLQEMTDRTVLLVTHRPAMLQLCSRRIVLGPDNA